MLSRAGGGCTSERHERRVTSLAMMSTSRAARVSSRAAGASASRTAAARGWRSRRASRSAQPPLPPPSSPPSARRAPSRSPASPHCNTPAPACPRGTRGRHRWECTRGSWSRSPGPSSPAPRADFRAPPAPMAKEPANVDQQLSGANRDRSRAAAGDWPLARRDGHRHRSTPAVARSRRGRRRVSFVATRTTLSQTKERDPAHWRDRASGAARRAVPLQARGRGQVARTSTGSTQSSVERMACDGSALTRSFASFAVLAYPDLHMIVYTPATHDDARELRALVERYEQLTGYSAFEGRVRRSRWVARYSGFNEAGHPRPLPARRSQPRQAAAEIAKSASPRPSTGGRTFELWRLREATSSCSMPLRSD